MSFSVGKSDDRISSSCSRTASLADMVRFRGMSKAISTLFLTVVWVHSQLGDLDIFELIASFRSQGSHERWTLEIMMHDDDSQSRGVLLTACSEILRTQGRRVSSGTRLGVEGGSVVAVRAGNRLSRSCECDHTYTQSYINNSVSIALSLHLQGSQDLHLGNYSSTLQPANMSMDLNKQPEWSWFKGRTVIVTGAANGLGRGMARQWAEHG